MTQLNLAELSDQVLSADVIVVGSGLAGAAVATSLAERGHSVIILESGNDSNPDAKWNIKREPFAAADYGAQQEYTDLHVRRQYGGGSAVWGGWCARPRNVSFAPGRLGESYGWPVERSSLDEYYERASVFLELKSSDPMSFDEIPLAATKKAVAIPYQFSPPVRVFDKYQEEFAGSERITIVLNATVTRLEETSGRISGCAVTTPDGEELIVTGRHFVVAGGAVGNARLLLTLPENSSVSEPSKRHIGRWMHEHPHQYNVFYTTVHPDLDKELQERSLIDQHGFVSIAPDQGTVEENGWSDFTFLLVKVPLTENPSFEPLSKNHVATFGVEPTIFRASLAMEQQADYEFSAIAPADAQQGLDGFLRLSFEGRQKEMAEAAKKWFTDNVSHLNVDTDNITEVVAVGHIHGTTRMASSSEDGVVDTATRVFGLPNLYVAGSSLFPSSGFANPTLNLCALAYITADQIHQELI